MLLGYGRRTSIPCCSMPGSTVSDGDDALRADVRVGDQRRHGPPDLWMLQIERVLGAHHMGGFDENS